jgi:large subunit ribosomal protein L1
MPNPKAGTVTMDVGKVIKEVKAGRIEFKMDKQGNVNVPVAKVSFSEQAIHENAKTLLEAVVHAKPSGVRGQFIRGMSLSATMGPGIKIDSQAWKRS